MTKGLKTKVRFNKTVINAGKIVRLRKDGTIAAVLDTWPPKKSRI
jgi:hypothetical protein